MVQLEKVEEPGTETSPETSPEATAEVPEATAEVPPTPAPEAPTPEAPEAPEAEASTASTAKAEPKRRGRPKGEPKPKPEPKKRGRPKKVEIGEPEVRTYTPEPPTPRPIATHQDFMRYVAIQSQFSKQLQRDHWRSLVRF